MKVETVQMQNCHLIMLNLFFLDKQRKLSDTSPDHICSGTLCRHSQARQADSDEFGLPNKALRTPYDFVSCQYLSLPQGRQYIILTLLGFVFVCFFVGVWELNWHKPSAEGRHTNLLNVSFMWYGSLHKEWRPKEVVKLRCLYIRLNKGICGKVSKLYGGGGG